MSMMLEKFPHHSRGTRVLLRNLELAASKLPSTSHHPQPSESDGNESSRIQQKAYSVWSLGKKLIGQTDMTDGLTLGLKDMQFLLCTGLK